MQGPIFLEISALVGRELLRTEIIWELFKPVTYEEVVSSLLHLILHSVILSILLLFSFLKCCLTFKMNDGVLLYASFSQFIN